MRGLCAHPFDAQRPARFRQWHLQLFIRAEESVYWAEVIGELLRRMRKLSRVEDIFDLPVSRDAVAKVRGQMLLRLLTDDGDAHVPLVYSCLDKARGVLREPRRGEYNEVHNSPFGPLL